MGISDADDVRVSGIIHQAFIEVDESGTEAATVTVFKMRATMMPMVPPEF